MRSSNKFAGYSYSLKRRQGSPFVRLGVLVAVAAGTMAALSAWSNRQPGQATAASSQLRPPAPAHSAASAHTTTPLLRPGYVVGYVAQSFADSTPLPGRFQSLTPTRQVAVA